MRKTVHAVVAALLLAIAACATTDTSDSSSASAAAPRYRVDASWPKALPNNWILGQVSGIWVVQKFVRVAD